MADKQAANGEQGAQPAKGRGRMGMVLGLAVAIAGGVGGYMASTMGLFGEPEAPLAVQEDAPDGEAQPVAVAPSSPAQYLALDPPFVVNFEDQGLLRYLQVGVSVMARDAAVIEAMDKNMPRLRNDLILLFGAQDVAALATLEGKEQLRQAALDGIEKVLREETGRGGAQAVYFTTFVMQ